MRAQPSVEVCRSLELFPPRVASAQVSDVHEIEEERSWFEVPSPASLRRDLLVARQTVWQGWLVADAMSWLKGLSCFESSCDDSCGEEAPHRVVRAER